MGLVDTLLFILPIAIALIAQYKVGRDNKYAPWWITLSAITWISIYLGSTDYQSVLLQGLLFVFYFIGYFKRK